MIRTLRTSPLVRSVPSSSPVGRAASRTSTLARVVARRRTARDAMTHRVLVLVLVALVACARVDATSYAKRASRAVAPRADATLGRLRAHTWGVGGERVGRPSNPASAPGRAELDARAGDVVAVAASGHTAAATASGRLYTAGRNDSHGGGAHGSTPIDDSGQLGRGGAAGAFERVGGALEGETVTSVGCGRYHTVCSTESGNVYSFGLNDVGQLGTSGVMGAVPVAKPRCDSGGNCEELTRDAGELAGLGESCFKGAACRIGTPKRVTFPEGDVKIKSVAAGRYTSAAVTQDGRVYVWGLNMCGVSSGRDKIIDDAATPRLIDGVQDIELVDIGYTGMILLNAKGEVYTCDTGYDGYARPSDGADVRVQRHSPFGDGDHKAIDVAAGRCHYAVATEHGALFTWGCSALGRGGDKRNPAAVAGDLSTRGVVAVAAGEYFTLAATSLGEIYGMGTNGNGQLGVQADAGPSFDSPVRVELGPGVGTCVAVAAGYQHSIAIVRESEDAR